MPSLIDSIANLQKQADQLKDVERCPQDEHTYQLILTRLAELQDPSLPCTTLAQAIAVLDLHDVKFDSVRRWNRVYSFYVGDMVVADWIPTCRLDFAKTPSAVYPYKECQLAHSVLVQP